MIPRPLSLLHSNKHSPSWPAVSQVQGVWFLSSSESWRNACVLDPSSTSLSLQPPPAFKTGYGPPSYLPVMWHLVLARQLHDYQCGFWTGLTLNTTVRKTDPNREQSVATYQHWSWISPLCPRASCAAAWKRTRSERKGFLLDLCLAGMHCKIKTPMSVFTLYFFAFL